MPSSVENLHHGDFFEKIVDNVPLALLLVSRNDQIVVANQFAEELFGYGSRELIGQRVDSLIAPGAVDWARVPVSAAAHPPSREVLGRRKNNVQVPLEATLTPLHTSKGRFTLACFTDATARARADAVAQEMTAIIESAEDAILTKSLEGTIRSWNPAAERILGYRAGEIVGTPVNRLIPDDLQDEETMILTRLRKGQRVAHFETIRRKNDGTLLDVSLTISPIRDRAGVVVGASKIMRDITDRKRTEATLRRSNAKLAQTNAELDEFVYTASHDLRSPLTNVGAVTQWILDDDPALSVQTRDRLMLIQSRIKRMVRLLHDVRDYARSGRYDETSGEQLSAAALVTEVAEGLPIPPEFSIRRDPSLEHVQIQRIPLAQVLHNLMDNAIKHHDRPTGSVAISVVANGPTLRFSVIDDGPGIPEEYREEVFGMFKTLRPRDEVEGSGMGLALARKIVARMGGACGVKPAINRGAEFWFDWPKVPQRAGPAP